MNQRFDAGYPVIGDSERSYASHSNGIVIAKCGSNIVYGGE